jgi:hypothetical protein
MEVKLSNGERRNWKLSFVIVIRYSLIIAKTLRERRTHGKE